MRVLALLCLIFCSSAFAKTMKTGLHIGYNYANLEARNATSTFSGTGGGIAGGLAFSFFEEKRFGFRLSSNYSNLNVTGGTKSVIGGAAFNAATLNVNFDFGPNRHSLGLGFGATFIPNSNFQGGAIVSNTFGGLVIEGKDFWKSGFYDIVQVFLLRDSSTLYQYPFFGILSIGYEF